MDRSARLRTRWTVLKLQRLPSEDWLATQDGEDEHGRGTTAAAAAAAYCQKVDDSSGAGGIDERERERDPPVSR